MTRYVMIVLLLAFAVGVAAPPLYYAHAITTVPMLCSTGAFGFALWLLDSTSFREYVAEVRDALKKGPLGP